MAVELHVYSETPALPWEKFTATHPVGSIALDGYVSGPPRYQADGPYQNFNHHEGVDRLATLSTAQQILKAVRMSMCKPFEIDGEFTAHAFVNDCDQDVCASWYLLDNIDQAKQVTNPMLNRFIEVAGTLDVTAGAFPYPKDLQLLGQLNWVFEPYTSFRVGDEMGNNDNAQYRSVITTVCERIQQHLDGSENSIEPDKRFKRIGGGKGWLMVEPIGINAAEGVFESGANAFVTVQQIDDATWRYGLRRRSIYEPFDLPKYYAELNKLEGRLSDLWGGADNAGGSPRVGGSKLPPSVVEAVINEN